MTPAPNRCLLCTLFFRMYEKRRCKLKKSVHSRHLFGPRPNFRREEFCPDDSYTVRLRQKPHFPPKAGPQSDLQHLAPKGPYFGVEDPEKTFNCLTFGEISPEEKTMKSTEGAYEEITPERPPTFAPKGQSDAFAPKVQKEGKSLSLLPRRGKGAKK